MPDNTRPPLLLGIGGAHIDRRGRLAGIFVPGASNPGRMSEEVGGVVFNALRCARRSGVAASLISLRGGDSAGERIAAEAANAGIQDLSATFLDRATASYTALIARDGEMIAGFADMDLYELFPRQLRRTACREAIAAADAILCDANLPAEALHFLADEAGSVALHAIGISPAKVTRLAALLDRLDVLFVNRREAAALTGTPLDADPVAFATQLRARGLGRGVVTGGGGELVAFEADTLFAVTPPTPEKVVDETGAGDAIAGVTSAELLKGRSFIDAVRAGMAAAKLAVESEASVPPFDDDALAEALADVPEARTVSIPKQETPA